MLNDITYGIRFLYRNPGFTAVTVLSLALGIGSNTVVFNWIQSLLLRPLPEAAQSDQLVVVVPTYPSGPGGGTSYPDLQDLAAQKQVLAGVIASQNVILTLGVGGPAEWVFGQLVTANFFDVLGVRPLLGRTFLPSEELKPGGHPVIVISEGLWKRRFGGDPGIIGKTVDLNRHTYTIVGITPPGFRGTMTGLRFDIWVPLMMHEQLWPGSGPLQKRDQRWLHAMARIRSGVDLKQAQAVATTLARQLAQSYPDTNKNVGVSLLPLWNSPYGGQRIFGPLLSILMTVTVGVLLIVMANVANLLLARATGRQKEIAVRLALGARRGRLIRQLLTESILLSLLGGAGGMIFALWAASLLAKFTPPSNLPLVVTLSFDSMTLSFSLLLALATGVIFGMAPALQSVRVDLNETLKEGERGAGGGYKKHRMRSLLVVSEVALSLLLLIGAGLCLRSLRNARLIHPGFEPNNVLLSTLNLTARDYSEQEGRDFFRRLDGRLSALPGIQSVAMAAWVPLGFAGSRDTTIEVDGYVPGSGENMNFLCNMVTPRYFELMRIPLVKGRYFTDFDHAKAAGAAIVNETLARRYWPGQDPLGRGMKVLDNRKVTVIGVVKDGKYISLGERPQPFVYVPYEQFYQANMTVHVRTAGEPAAMATALRREIQAIDMGVTPWSTDVLTNHIEAAFLAPRIAATLLSILGLLALILAAMGVYGVMAYAVNSRTHEIGIRMALGARTTDVLGLMIRQGMQAALVGICIGLLAALGLMRAMSSQLYGVGARDPLIFSGMILVLTIVAFLACYVPARRAAKVNPIEALRYE